MTGCQLSLYVHFLAFILDFYTCLLQHFNESDHSRCPVDCGRVRSLSLRRSYVSDGLSISHHHKSRSTPIVVMTPADLSAPRPRTGLLGPKCGDSWLFFFGSLKHWLQDLPAKPHHRVNCGPPWASTLWLKLDPYMITSVQNYSSMNWVCFCPCKILLTHMEHSETVGCRAIAAAAHM